MSENKKVKKSAVLELFNSSSHPSEVYEGLINLGLEEAPSGSFTSSSLTAIREWAKGDMASFLGCYNQAMKFISLAGVKPEDRGGWIQRVCQSLED